MCLNPFSNCFPTLHAVPSYKMPEQKLRMIFLCKHTEMLGEIDYVPVWVTCWENRQLLTSLIHGWVTALLAFIWSPPSKIFDRLLNKVCLKFLFNISKMLIQQDVSSGVLHVTKSAAVEIHSLQHEMFS